MDNHIHLIRQLMPDNDPEAVHRDFLKFLPMLRVSRIKDHDKFFECWIKDGRRSTAYAVQTEYANHLKVL
jgi:hypothetical protein